MQRPRLKPVIRTTHGSLLILSPAPGVAIRIEDPDGANARLLDLLDGSRTLSELTLPGYSTAEIREGVATLADAGLLVEESDEWPEPELRSVPTNRSRGLLFL